jgi:ABC-type lipoprotein export system ATPase subunit
MEPLIRLEDIRKTYRLGEVEVPVLKGISLTIDRGEMVALMGASGSGKTTLMNLLGCLDRPTSGTYVLDGEDVSQLTADERALIRNRKVGFVFQNFNLLARTSALENVMMPLEYAAVPLSERECRARARTLLERVGLGDRLDHDPSQMSGGQQQRVAIARALVNQPPVLFADEPTGNLDSKTSQEILEMFKELNKRDGITIVLVTHGPEVAAHAQRTIHIRDGLIQAGAFNAAGG